ncbi:tyrosine-protein phosphatase 10D-like [Haliotis rufescens]|uniref:tyrosine-protein phosphatase 10D-like n=1 Tax=Haliotis rufescens TaxID=6454 RepID=UPI00201FAC41|nr:tyrosine-protein phosphatase 10D-like [Haliotis rufescens]
MTVYGFYLLTLLAVLGYQTCSASTSTPTAPTTPTTTNTTPQPKQEYGGTCSTSIPCDDANKNIFCNSLVTKCLCVDGRYHNGQACIQYSTLSPRFGTTTTGTSYVYVQWSDQTATNYDDEYQLTISPDGKVGATTGNFYNFTNLQQRTNYLVSLVRTISRYGRNQSLPAVTTTTRTKVGYNRECDSASDTCIDTHTSCQGDECRCNGRFYWDTGCVSIDGLSPTSVSVTVDSTTTMTATWESPSNAIVTGYEVTVTPGNIIQILTREDIKTTPITGLTPGRQYIVSVETKITYLQGRDEKTTAVSAQPKVTTPDTVDRLSDKTNLTAPDIIIDFPKADGDVQYYLVQLQGITNGSYNKSNYVYVPEMNTAFSGVVSNYQYNLTITTHSNQQKSTPYIQTIRVMASQAGTVENFQSTSFTSRNITMSWMRPVSTNGDLYEYRLEVLNGTCKQRIVLNCTECKRNASVEGSENCEVTTVVPISESNIKNPMYIVNSTITGLLPDTQYFVKVAAYNQEGRGMDSYLPLTTDEEAASEPTTFIASQKTSDRITLTWAPPVPRPGATHYNISIYEKNENTSVYDYIDTKGIIGYNHNMCTVTNLSSAWEYKFYIQAFTMKGGSEKVSSDVMTEESAPTKVVQYFVARIPNVYNSIKLSWECPKKKDGRNGIIKSSTLIYHSNKTSAKDTKKERRTYDNINDCRWNQDVEVTAGFSYSFTVFLQNTVPGAQSTIYEYIEAGCEYILNYDSKLCWLVNKDSQGATSRQYTVMIVGAASAVVVFVIIVVLVKFFFGRRRNVGQSARRLSTQGIQIGNVIANKRPIRISEFVERVDDMHKDSNMQFSDEFEDIGTISPKHACAASETGGNKLRNRYVNILPFDHTRVKLRSLADDDEDDSDYINANYIPGYNSPREYIATQGPMTGTVADFWRMIWEQDVHIIIMLSDLMEKGKPKVDRYWPENINEPVQHGEIIVEMINYSPLSKYVIKIFKITKRDESRKVRHYFLPGWQDFGANLTSDDVISFVRDVRMTIKPTEKGPICVHCSAGVGRTGTYVSLDVFKQAIDEENFDKELDVFDFVMRMRENRSYMVQTEKQYIFIYDTIKEMIIRKRKEIVERENIYQNNDNYPEENIYTNEGYEPDPEEMYMNV